MVTVGGVNSPVRSGRLFGEMSVLDGSPRSATVTATSGCRTMGLTSWNMRSLIKEYPEIALHLVDVLVARVRATDANLRRREIARLNVRRRRPHRRSTTTHTPSTQVVVEVARPTPRLRIGARRRGSRGSHAASSWRCRAARTTRVPSPGGTISSSHCTRKLHRAGELRCQSLRGPRTFGPPTPIRPSRATRIRSSLAETGRPIIVPIDKPHQPVLRGPNSPSMKSSASPQSVITPFVPPPSSHTRANHSSPGAAPVVARLAVTWAVDRHGGDAALRQLPSHVHDVGRAFVGRSAMSQQHEPIRSPTHRRPVDARDPRSARRRVEGERAFDEPLLDRLLCCPCHRCLPCCRGHSCERRLVTSRSGNESIAPAQRESSSDSVRPPLRQ